MAIPPGQAANAEQERITGPAHVLRIGMWSAWVLVPTFIAYFGAVFASGAARGFPKDPYWAIAEILTIVGAPIQVILFASIHESAPPRGKLYSLLGFGWMLVMAALTVTVHFVELTVARRIDVLAAPGLVRVFDFRSPSLILGVELLAWHLFFGLSLLFAASAFRGPGMEAAVRVCLRVGGALCIAGLIGPVVGDPRLRLIGVFGYGVVFPISCVMMGFVFKQALARSRS